MRFVVALVLLAGCDKLFLQENTLAPDASPFDAPPKPGCPPEFAGGRYFVLTSQLTWPAAEAACRMLGGTYSHLAVIGDGAEAGMLGGRIASDAWVGLTDLKRTPPVFHWITEEPAGMPWITGQPDDQMRVTGNCGRVLNDGSGLADGPCVTDSRRAICECDEYPVDVTRF